MNKSVVERIQEELRSAVGSQIALDYENALRLVSEVVFTRSAGFVLEFVQNAEDSGLGVDSQGTFEISLNRDRIKIVHNGRPFTEQDVRAICGIRSSKRPEKGTLGYLGIGFKSVFKVTNCPQVYSGGFQFKFDRNYWPAGTALWRVLPIWVEEPPEPIDPALTTFVIPFRDSTHYSALQSELENLGTELYLFLRWLRRIHVQDETAGKRCELLNLGEEDGVGRLQRNGTVQRFKFLRNVVHVPNDVQKDELSQEYRRSVTEREIAVAFALDENGNLEPSAAGAMYGGVYSFIPLGEASSGARFPIQADFLVQPGREAINCEARWNHWLVEEIARLCKEAIRQFKTHEVWKHQFLPVFATQTTQSEAYQKLFGPKLLEPLGKFLNTEHTIPTKSGGWAAPGQLIRLSESAAALESLHSRVVLRDDELATAFGENSELLLVHPLVKDGGIGGINITKVDRWNLLRNEDFLRSKAGTEGSPDWFRALYLWLQSNPVFEEFGYGRRKRQQIQGYHSYTIVLSADKKLLPGGQTYLLDIPATEETISDLAAQLAGTKPLLHPDILGKASSDAEQQLIRGFLIGLTGVQVLDAARVCQDVLLPKLSAKSEMPSHEELVKWTRLCKDILKHNIPDDTEIWVLTKDGGVRAGSECLFSVEFGPELDWETYRQYVPGMHFVSPSYLESSDAPDIGSWRAFFRKCGVNDTLDKKGVEEYAMRFAEEALRTVYASVKRVDTLNLGYDLIAENTDEQAIQVEVKGTTGDGTVELTDNETTAADKYKDSFYLCVVAGIPSTPASYMVQNPAEKGKKEKLTVPSSVWKAFRWKPQESSSQPHSLRVGVRRRFDGTVVVYCDESSHNAHRYFVLGSVFFALKPSVDADEVTCSMEQELQSIKDEYGLDRVKWEKIPTKPGRKLEGYKRYVRKFLETKEVLFKCMVVDTSKYPLANPKLWERDSLVGYLKFYCVFLSDGLMQKYSTYFFDIRIDQFEFRPDCDCRLLEKTVERRFIKKSRPEPCLSYCSVKAFNHRQHNLLQLADLLVGAVGFVWNGGMARQSARAATRKELVGMIQEAHNVDLSAPTTWTKQDFNIWLLRPNPLPSSEN